MDRALIHTLVPADKIVEPLFEGISTWDEHLTEFSAGGAQQRALAVERSKQRKGQKSVGIRRGPAI